MKEETNMKKNRISIIGIISIVLGLLVFSLIGVSLPKTINLINGFNEYAFYGYFASYAVSILLFWMFFKDNSFIIKRESYFKKINNFINKLEKTKNGRTKRGRQVRWKEKH